MYISSLHVQNFRSIRDEALPCDRLTALIGSNGAGKSSFLHALDLFYRPGAPYTTEDFYNQDTSKEIVITVTFAGLSDEEKELFRKYIERLSQNAFAGRGCPPPGPSPTWRYPMESRFILLALNMVQMIKSSEESVPIGAY